MKWPRMLPRKLLRRGQTLRPEKRSIQFNDSEANLLSNFVSNKIRTTKYTWISFLPRGLYEQFRRVANLYFLFHAVLSLTPISPVNPVTTILPLVFVIGLAMLKELWEDVQRGKSDREINNRNVDVLQMDGGLQSKQWREVCVGDIVRVEGDNSFPADLLCLQSSDPEGICYVETMNLDGETNLKMRKAVNDTMVLSLEQLKGFKALIECEQPNISIYTFAGNLIDTGPGRLSSSLNPNNILLRGTVLRNTEYVTGIVIFTGGDSKIMMNASEPPSKRSTIERRLDFLVISQLCLLVLMSVTSAIVFGVLLHKKMKEQWYLQPGDIHQKSSIATAQFNWHHSAIAAFLQFFTALILYGYFVPISLYVTIEVVKLIQSKFINADKGMHYVDKDIPARARTSNLNEELGMVNTILSDKTGTLTRNQMDFLKCSIAGISYGDGDTEVGKDAEFRAGHPAGLEEEQEMYTPELPLEKGYNMKDVRLDSMKWLEQPTKAVIRQFLEVLSVCHTVVTSGGNDPQTIKYQAESPDEAAFVVASKRLGMFFHKRNDNVIHVREYGPGWKPMQELEYKVLNTLEFTSARKRMSVVVRTPEGSLLLMCKGADSVILERLAYTDTARQYLRATKAHMTEYAEAGLRTLALAYKLLDEDEYAEWQKRWLIAKQDVSSAANQAEKLEHLAEELEQNLNLIGSSAIEDKLQVGVPQTIENLANAGIKMWVLTGDKMETAINIGYACSLLRHNMQQHVISSEDDKVTLEAARAVGSGSLPGDKETRTSKEEKFYLSRVARLLEESNEEVKRVESPRVLHAIIIDGKSLAYALNDDHLRSLFLNLAVKCDSVICCRASPKQKAQVTELVRNEGKQICLGIGDGANDVGMIQKADIGVGISGEEGQQAVMAADFSIGQFRFLERLLLIHGGWSYKRITRMINYFFYKNFVFGFTIFFYNSFAQMSGASVYWDWYLSLYNVIFTSIPVGVLACIDQDVKGVLHLRFPRLYQQGQDNTYFKTSRILVWLLDGLYQAIVCFSFTMAAYHVTSDRADGKILDHWGTGTAMFTCVILVVNLQMVLAIQYWTWIHHLAIWGSIVVYFLFVLVVGIFPVKLSGVAYKLFVETAASWTFWLLVLITCAAAIFPTLIFRSIQRNFFPEDHHIIQEISRIEFRRQKKQSLLRRRLSTSPTSLEMMAIPNEALPQDGPAVTLQEKPGLGGNGAAVNGV